MELRLPPRKHTLDYRVCGGGRCFMDTVADNIIAGLETIDTLVQSVIITAGML